MSETATPSNVTVPATFAATNCRTSEEGATSKASSVWNAPHAWAISNGIDPAMCIPVDYLTMDYVQPLQEKTGVALQSTTEFLAGPSPTIDGY